MKNNTTILSFTNITCNIKKNVVKLLCRFANILFSRMTRDIYYKKIFKGGDLQ